MVLMPSADATRLLLFADGHRADAPTSASKVRRYKLARLRLEAARRDEPRYAYLKRSHD